MSRVASLVSAGLIAGALLAGSLGEARVYASHEHYIDTPGTCVADVAHGQTSKGPGEGGYHRFHENVHLGRPGTAAFANETNPVSVGKGTCPA